MRGRIRRSSAAARCWKSPAAAGYWTQFIARSAAKVHACDINEAVLEIAREKPIPKGRVDFFKADAVTLEGVPAGLRRGVRGLLVVAREEERPRALRAQPRRARRAAPWSPSSTNQYAEGSSTAISRRDAEGNTYQQRRLANGEEYEVLKNFPTAAELAEAVRPVAREAHLESLTYYWLMVFTLR